MLKLNTNHLYFYKEDSDKFNNTKIFGGMSVDGRGFENSPKTIFVKNTDVIRSMIAYVFPVPKIMKRLHLAKFVEIRLSSVKYGNGGIYASLFANNDNINDPIVGRGINTSSDRATVARSHEVNCILSTVVNLAVRFHNILDVPELYAAEYPK